MRNHIRNIFLNVAFGIFATPYASAESDLFEFSIKNKYASSGTSLLGWQFRAFDQQSEYIDPFESPLQVSDPNGRVTVPLQGISDGVTWSYPDDGGGCAPLTTLLPFVYNRAFSGGFQYQADQDRWIESKAKFTVVAIPFETTTIKNRLKTLSPELLRASVWTLEHQPHEGSPSGIFANNGLVTPDVLNSFFGQNLQARNQQYNELIGYDVVYLMSQIYSESLFNDRIQPGNWKSFIFLWRTILKNRIESTLRLNNFWESTERNFEQLALQDSRYLDPAYRKAFDDAKHMSIRLRQWTVLETALVLKKCWPYYDNPANAADRDEDLGRIARAIGVLDTHDSSLESFNREDPKQVSELLAKLEALHHAISTETRETRRPSKSNSHLAALWGFNPPKDIVE